MGPGASAEQESKRALLEAALHRRAAREAEDRARGYGIAARTEPLTAEALQSLERHGWQMLHDRRWPGTRGANLDHVAVGPGGVLVIDTKAWSGSVRVAGGSIFHDDECRDDAVEAVHSQALAVEERLADLGLAPLEVVPVMCLVRRGASTVEAIGRVRVVGAAGLQRLAMGRGVRMSPAEVAVVAARLDETCPPAAPGRRVSAVLPAAVIPLERTDQPSERLFSDDELLVTATEAAARGSIERWMTFIDPEQMRLVRRSFSGPMRIRGAAGTGKTVVGLHRAAYLAAAHPGARMLFTSFVRTLPAVLRNLYTRLAPDSVDRIEFVGLHRWASDHLRDRGVRVRLDSDRSGAAFDAAFKDWRGRARLVTPSTPYGYWRDEVDAVIKGRGLHRFEQYDALVRVGRKTRLTSDDRQLVWELYTAYDAKLRERGIHDFNDLIGMALRSVEDEPLVPAYGAVIADEVQDLNMLGARLVMALAGDGADGLTLIGDGQQAVYPGGYTLSEAGIAVTGRSFVLRTNYRNTRAILDYATKLVAEDDFGDLDADLEQGRRDVHVVRQGAAPVEAHAASRAAHDQRMVHELRRAVRDGVALGDMAVLVPTNKLVVHYRAVLGKAKIPTIALTDYEGVPTAAVKVGTFQRAKGLEFARVFLPQVALPGEGTQETDPARLEQLERERRTYFVAMTRARDALWVGFCTDQATSRRQAAG
jgi:hypothetical protein